MPEIICPDCEIRLFHENEETLKIEENVHKKFCRKKKGETYSYMHRDDQHTSTFDTERTMDNEGTAVLKK